MQNRSLLESQVEDVIRTSEILAVARALRAGDRLQLGQTVDYFLEPQATGLIAGPISPTKSGKPYRTVVEQWHLDAANQMLRTR
jgi:hypothetical protein